MIIKLDNVYYSVNIHKYTGSKQVIADKVVSEVLRRVDTRGMSILDQRRLRTKIYNQVHLQA